MTNELNIYLERLSASVISMVEEIRKLGPTGLKWWVNQDEFTVAGDRIQKLIKEVLRGEIVEHAINFPVSDRYFEWNLKAYSQQLSSRGLKALIYRTSHFKSHFVVLSETPKNKDYFYGFMDNQGNQELPCSWCRCQWITSFSALDATCREGGHLKFKLRDNPLYDQTHVTPVKGALVYRERKTGRYVHKDTKHQNHYEVYDCNGVHIGILSEDGKFMPGTAVQGRRLDL